MNPPKPLVEHPLFLESVQPQIRCIDTGSTRPSYPKQAGVHRIQQNSTAPTTYQAIVQVTLLLAVSFTVVGCSRTTPIYLREGETVSRYLDQATRVDYPDVDLPPLDEVSQSHAPITVIDPDFHSYYDLTLEDAVSFGLHNAKIMRGYGTPGMQNSRVLPGIDNLINSPQAAGTIWNVAVRETEPGFLGTPGQIANPGSILTNTGLDVNQGVESALAEFDAQFTSNMSFIKSDEPRNTIPLNPISPLVFQQDQFTWQSEIAKKSATGTQIFFRNSNTYFDNNNPLAVDGGLQVLDSWYRTAFEAEVRQPLMRGRGAFINRMPIIVSRIGTDQEIANLEAQLQNFVTNIEIRYWDLYLAYRNLDAAQKGRDAALETWKIVKDQFDEGADVNVQQVAQAAQQFISFNTQVTEAFNQILNAQNQLRFLLGWSSSDGMILRPTNEPITAQIEYDWFESLVEALTYRPEIRSERWEIKKRELALAYAKNGLLPELNATALYRWLGLGNKFGTDGGSSPFPDAGSAALNELFKGNYQEMQVGVDFRAPIGFRREMANVRNAQLKLAREIARLEDMELDATKELTEAFQALALNQQLMQQAWDRWRYITMELEHFQVLREAGVERLDVALDAQQRQAQAEIAFYTAMIEYNKIIALIHRRKGTILAYNGIEFSEGPWSGKAYLDAQEHARRRSASREMNYGWTRPQVISRGEQYTPNHNVGMPVSGRQSSNEGVYSDPGYFPYDNGELYLPMENGELIPPLVDPYSNLNSNMNGFPNQGMPIPTPIQGRPLSAVPSTNKNGNDRERAARSGMQQEVQLVSYEQSVSTANPTNGNVGPQDFGRDTGVSLNANAGRPPIHRYSEQPSRLVKATADSSSDHRSSMDVGRAVNSTQAVILQASGQPPHGNQGVHHDRPSLNRDRLQRLGLEQNATPSGAGNFAKIQVH